jgi:hypothetical protein
MLHLPPYTLTHFGGFPPAPSNRRMIKLYRFMSKSVPVLCLGFPRRFPYPLLIRFRFRRRGFFSFFFRFPFFNGMQTINPRSLRIAPKKRQRISIRASKISGSFPFRFPFPISRPVFFVNRFPRFFSLAFSR